MQDSMPVTTALPFSFSPMSQEAAEYLEHLREMARKDAAC
jgi:hypothetical protein